MNILTVVDYKGWAISKLADAYIKNLPHFSWKVLEIHPRNILEHIDSLKKELEWADVIIIEYWRSAQEILKHVPEIKNKKLILMHHNQKNLLSEDWNDFKMLLCHTNKSKEILLQKYPEVRIIPYAIDHDEFSYDEDYALRHHKKAIGYCGRIVPWKNLKEIARAAYELEVPLVFMGKMDKPSYWEEIPPEHQKNIDMSFYDVSDKDRIEFYRNITVFAQFSSDGREEGTLPLLEAMASGVPVVSSPAGIAADILVDGKNAVLTEFDNYQQLKDGLKKVLDDLEFAKKIRQEAWQAVKVFTPTRAAWEYEKAIYHVHGGGAPLVSVIIPTYNSLDNLKNILFRLGEQTYKNIEAVVCDDGSSDETETMVKMMRYEVKYPIKWCQTSNFAVTGVKPYGLAHARNLGVIESQGEYLMFCDSRLLPAKDAVEQFLYNAERRDKHWLFGDKGSAKTSFVENFSFIARSDLINGGMFNERIDSYGGMSQELRSRFSRQGITTKFIVEVKAEQLSKSKLNNKRRKDIIKTKDLLWKLEL